MYSELFLWAQVPSDQQWHNWGDVFESILKDPLLFMQQHFVWVFIILIAVFMISRLNNNLEVRGVNQAITISRGFVSTFIAFVVAPIAIILFINVIGLIYGLPTIDLWNIWRWISLLGTTLWWLGKCLFGGAPLMENLYDGNSLTRLALILVPLSFVWIRTANTGFGRLALVPFIFSIMFITKNKVAPDTFMTDFLKERYPGYFYSGAGISPHSKEALVIGVDSLSSKRNLTKDVGGDMVEFYKKNTFQVSLFLGFMLLLALLIGYVFKKPKLGAVVAVLAIFLYFMMGENADKGWLPNGESTSRRQAQLDALIKDFMMMYEANHGQSNLQMTKIATEINSRMKEDAIAPPDSFCLKYKDYFYDLCTVKNDEVMDE